jgi:hypothetical protein
MDAYRTAAAQPEPPAPEAWSRPSAAYVLFAWTVQLVVVVVVALATFRACLALGSAFRDFGVRLEMRAICDLPALGAYWFFARRARHRRTSLHPSPWFFW